MLGIGSGGSPNSASTFPDILEGMPRIQIGIARTVPEVRIPWMLCPHRGRDVDRRSWSL